MTTGGLPCHYCGQRHARAAEVRSCWQRSMARRSAHESGPARQPSRNEHQVGGAVLGRSVVVAPGQPPPAAWQHCERASGDLDELEAAWRDRIPLIIEAPGGPATKDEVERRPVWSLSPDFAFPGERRFHATFANAVDARSGTLCWPLAASAAALGATLGGPADIVLSDGRPAYLDGGPLCWQPPLNGAAIVPRLTVQAGSLEPFGANETDAPLAADQLVAVTYAGGSTRIIAPAGSGKTRVLTERARHLLRRWNLPGKVITLVAFNRRAAAEIRQRTVDLPELQVRTLNALGLSVLAASGPANTIGEREVRGILDTLVNLPRRTQSDPAAAWIEALSLVRLGLRAPAEVEAEFGGDVRGLTEVFDRYRAVLRARRLVDFDEQVYRAIEILLKDPAARASARRRCRALLVDEVQDLTPAHVLLLRLLAGPDGAVFGAGDDDQTIYGYSGASPEWLIDFARLFPGAGEHALEINYRCPEPVVRAARTLLTHNRHRVTKRIVAAKSSSQDRSALGVTVTPDPLATTLELVASLVERGVPPQEVIVLGRVSACLAPVQVGLVHRQIPVQAAVDHSYLSRAGIQAALAWLRLALAPRAGLASTDLMLAARRPPRACSPRLVEWIGEQRDLAGIERLASRLSRRDGEKVAGFVTDLRNLRRLASSGTTAMLLAAVRDDIGLDRAMDLLEGAHHRLDRSAQTDDLDALVALGALQPQPSDFEDWLRASLASPDSPQGIALATIHRVKGREWPHVVLHEVTDGLLPHRLACDLEEERRVLHVGLTRAVSSVHIVGGEPPSPFLSELGAQWTPQHLAMSQRRATEHRHTGASRAPAPGPGRPPRAKKRDPAQYDQELVPSIGTELSFGGHRHRVVEVDGDGVTTQVGRAHQRIAYGERVIAAGRPARLVAGTPPAVVARARNALRAWRAQRAASEKKPAFVYLNDQTLERLATCLPTTLAQMAKVDGIGAAKLRAYGSELLGLLEAARGQPDP